MLEIYHSAPRKTGHSKGLSSASATSAIDCDWPARESLDSGAAKRLSAPFPASRSSSSLQIREHQKQFRNRQQNS